MAGRLKNYFFRGLAVLVPTIVTIWIFVWGYQFIHNTIGIHFKHGIEFLIVKAGGSAEELDTRWVDAALSAAGFIIALSIVFVVGVLLASVVGRALWRQVEKFIMNTPFLRQVYPYVKQVTDFFLSGEEKKQMFSRVVAVEYPRKGIWSMALVTGSGMRKIVEKGGREFLTLLIPTSPTPFTGFVIMVPKADTIELDITIEQALRFAVSAGVIAPGARMASLPAADVGTVEAAEKISKEN